MEIVEVANEHLANFFKAIKSGGVVDELIELGLEYFQIAQILTYCLEKKFVVRDGYNIKITEQGYIKYSILMKSIQKNPKAKGIEKWVKPLQNVKTKKMRKNDVYIPSK